MANGERVSTQKKTVVVRDAEAGGQTIHIDLCYVPASHEAQAKLPAVSGSSGRLVVERMDAQQPSYPGQVFEQSELDYVQAMEHFVAASRQGDAARNETVNPLPDGGLKASLSALRRDERQLAFERRVLREQRRLEDQAWKQFRGAYRQQQTQWQSLSRWERKACVAQWQAARDQRRIVQRQRDLQDVHWRQQRQALLDQLAQLPQVRHWTAILLVVDNCTRQCLGLPLFVAGANTTADEVIAALQLLLPPALQFLISDRGSLFTSDRLTQLATDAGFVHVLTARHRPQSNGIVERLVRTLKVWLRDKHWLDDLALAHLLDDFLLDYNNRPHQGLPIPGLSPNEFANRLWLL